MQQMSFNPIHYNSNMLYNHVTHSALLYKEGGWGDEVQLPPPPPPTES